METRPKQFLDRFIPARQGGDAERQFEAYHTTPIDCSQPHANYRVALASVLGLDVAAGSRILRMTTKVETKGNVSLLDRIRRDRLIKLAKQTVPVPRPSRTRMLDLPDFVDDFYAQHLAVTEKCAVVVLQGEVFVSNAPYLDSGNQEWPLLSIQVTVPYWMGKIVAVAPYRGNPNLVLMASASHCLSLWDMSTVPSPSMLEYFHLSGQAIGAGLFEGKGEILTLECLPNHTVWIGTRGSGRILTIDAKLAKVTGVWRVPTQELSHVCNIVSSPDGEFVAVGMNANMLLIYHHNAKEPRCQIPTTAAVKAIAWSPHTPNKLGHGRLLAFGGGRLDTHLYIYDVSAKRLVTRLATCAQITSLLWCPHHPRMLVSAHGSTAQPNSFSSSLDIPGQMAVWLLHGEDTKNQAQTLRLVHSFSPSVQGRVLAMEAFNGSKSVVAVTVGSIRDSEESDVESRTSAAALEMWHVFPSEAWTTTATTDSHDYNPNRKKRHRLAKEDDVGFTPLAPLQLARQHPKSGKFAVCIR